jgi:hypothetical protein
MRTHGMSKHKDTGLHCIDTMGGDLLSFFISLDGTDMQGKADPD